MSDKKLYVVADYIVNKYSKITSTLHLEKIIYYAQAWSLAIKDKEMFSTKIYALSKGPVSKELREKCGDMFFIENKDFFKDFFDKDQNLTADDIDVLDEVLEVYGGYSGSELSGITHQETPWLTSYKEDKDDFDETTIITNDSMKAYYKSIMNKVD